MHAWDGAEELQTAAKMESRFPEKILKCYLTGLGALNVNDTRFESDDFKDIDQRIIDPDEDEGRSRRPASPMFHLTHAVVELPDGPGAECDQPGEQEDRQGGSGPEEKGERYRGTVFQGERDQAAEEERCGYGAEGQGESGPEERGTRDPSFFPPTADTLVQAGARCFPGQQFQENHSRKDQDRPEDPVHVPLQEVR